MVADSRDTQTENRLKHTTKALEEFGLHPLFYCNTVCPMGVAPLDQINKIKQEIWLTRKFPTAAHSTPQGIGGVS